MDILQTLLDLFTNYGYIAVFIILLICGCGVPIPEDITLVAGGVIAGLAYANVHYMFLVGMLGVLAGDSAMFIVGRLLGYRVMRFRLIARLLTPERFTVVQEKFEQYGNWVLFFARFLPGLRSPIFITAGMTGRIRYWQFLLMDSFAAFISVPIWVYLGYYGATNRAWLMKMVYRGQVGIVVALGLVAIVVGYIWWRHYKKKQIAK